MLRHAVAESCAKASFHSRQRKNLCYFQLRRNDAPEGANEHAEKTKANELLKRVFEETHRGEKKMSNKNGDFEISTNTYIFAGVGGVLLGGLAAAALGGMQNIVAAGVVGALAGGCLGLFF